MSSSRALCCLPSVNKQKHDLFFRSMYNKTFIRFGFCDLKNNQGLGKGYQPQPSAPDTGVNIVLYKQKTGNYQITECRCCFIFNYRTIYKKIKN